MRHFVRRKIAAALTAAMLFSVAPVNQSLISFAAASTKKTNSKSTKSEKKELSLGSVKKNVYENDYFGLKLAAPDGFIFGDAAAVAEIDGSTEKFIKDKDAVIKSIKEGNPVTVAYAENEDTLGNICVTISISDGETDIKKMFEDSIPDIKDSLKESGIKTEDVSVVKKKVSGKDTYLLSAHGLIDDEYDIYQKEYMGIQDDYYICIAFTSFMTDDTDDMIKFIELK